MFFFSLVSFCISVPRILCTFNFTVYESLLYLIHISAFSCKWWTVNGMRDSKDLNVSCKDLPKLALQMFYTRLLFLLQTRRIMLNNLVTCDEEDKITNTHLLWAHIIAWFIQPFSIHTPSMCRERAKENSGIKSQLIFDGLKSIQLCIEASILEADVPKNLVPPGYVASINSTLTNQAILVCMLTTLNTHNFVSFSVWTHYLGNEVRISM